jgi:polyisoprenoid-binding protein YceI
MNASNLLHIDPAHSSIQFAVKHMMVATVRGQFRSLKGSILLDRARPEASSVEVAIDAASIDTRIAARDEHLRSPDFFAAETHPSIRFRSVRLEGDPFAEGKPFRLIGELTMRGVTREVVLTARYTGSVQDPEAGSPRFGFSAEATIDRRDWGLTWNQALETGGLLVGNEIGLRLEVSALAAQLEAAA